MLKAIRIIYCKGLQIVTIYVIRFGEPVITVSRGHGFHTVAVWAEVCALVLRTIVRKVMVLFGGRSARKVYF